MAASLKDWISAARLRTLPLAFSSVLMGSTLAFEEGNFKFPVFFLALLTTLFLQVLSNYANDYGDTMNGADNEDRVGPQRAVQSGKISLTQMRNGIIVCALAALLSGISLLYISSVNTLAFIFLLIIGLLAILAALKYTAGKNPYGYRALGDLFVFLFFGMVAVLGTVYLYRGGVPNAMHVLPASSIGFLSVAVLNLNNMRDLAPDKAAGKRTMAVMMGFETARVYHAILVTLSFILLISYVLLTGQHPTRLVFLLTAIPLVLHLIRVFKCKEPRLLDPELKIVALSTFFLTVLFGASLVI